MARDAGGREPLDRRAVVRGAMTGLDPVTGERARGEAVDDGHDVPLIRIPGELFTAEAFRLGLEELAARHRAARDPVERDRWQMIRLLVAGRSLAETAEVTGYSTRWVREVVRRYNEQGPDGLVDGRHANPGAAPLLDAAGRAALEVALKQAPPEGGRWTCAKVAAWIADRTGQEKVPAQRGWVYLRRTGHSPQVPRPRHVRAADPAAQAAFQQA